MKNLNNRFKVAPSTSNMKHSTFDIPYRKLDTGNFGELIPFYVNEVMPGDTFEVTTRLFSRMSTPLYPVADNAWIDYFYFFVPNRLVYERWPEFLGENKYKAWANDTEYFLPHAKVIPEIGSVYDHMGIPTYSEDNDVAISLGGRPELDVQFLPMRAYHLIWNEWFRNENTTDPILVNTGDGVDADEIERFQTLCKASKPFDAFTSALPSPQKGDAIDIPLTGNALVKTSSLPLNLMGDDDNNPIIFKRNGSGGDDNFVVGGTVNALTPGQVKLDGIYSADGMTKEETSLGKPVNLYADLSSVSAATINQLRQAFQMQRLLEVQARSGSRYTEIIRASFAVVSPDARLQRPEYLGGSKVQIQMQQVAQTAPVVDNRGNDVSPLGKVGAYSKTVSMNRDFATAFTEHGYVIGVAVARHDLTYSQGLNPMWSRRGRFDFYWPTFAHIGEQPISRRVLFATGNEEEDDLVFGYQEAWWDYRYKPSEICGMFRSTVNGNLDEWHYGEYYDSAPLLSSEWMEANGVTVDRTLAVSAAVHPQLIFNFAVDLKATRPMPLYSIPGLIDHF